MSFSQHNGIFKNKEIAVSIVPKNIESTKSFVYSSTTNGLTTKPSIPWLNALGIAFRRIRMFYYLFQKFQYTCK